MCAIALLPLAPACDQPTVFQDIEPKSSPTSQPNPRPLHLAWKRWDTAAPVSRGGTPHEWRRTVRRTAELSWSSSDAKALSKRMTVLVALGFSPGSTADPSAAVTRLACPALWHVRQNRVRYGLLPHVRRKCAPLFMHLEYERAHDHAPCPLPHPTPIPLLPATRPPPQAPRPHIPVPPLPTPTPLTGRAGQPGTSDTGNTDAALRSFRPPVAKAGAAKGAWKPRISRAPLSAGPSTPWRALIDGGRALTQAGDWSPEGGGGRGSAVLEGRAPGPWGRDEAGWPGRARAQAGGSPAGCRAGGVREVLRQDGALRECRTYERQRPPACAGRCAYGEFRLGSGECRGNSSWGGAGVRGERTLTGGEGRARDRGAVAVADRWPEVRWAARAWRRGTPTRV